ncbi:hypothetical protein NDU88_000697 [Pleurodeles waltl]|uniref:Uncharacterized protein n=1 Tax=Pleurodeles waltl TaxID=8319 RepID=A0AAV7MKF8_PLEWA|nr:hypothetical protein NDU88_000697 [Pleurodeles waltl]
MTKEQDLKRAEHPKGKKAEELLAMKIYRYMKGAHPTVQQRRSCVFTARPPSIRPGRQPTDVLMSDPELSV